jgi:hypothetical protein
MNGLLSGCCVFPSAVMFTGDAMRSEAFAKAGISTAAANMAVFLIKSLRFIVLDV